MNTAATWRVGIDLGGTSLRLLGESENGERSEVTTVPTARDYEDLLTKSSHCSTSVVAGPILSIGCGICGTLDGTRPVFVPALPWIEAVPSRDDLAELADASVAARPGRPLHAPRGGSRGIRNWLRLCCTRRRRDRHWRGDHARSQDLAGRARNRRILRVVERVGGKGRSGARPFRTGRLRQCAIRGRQRVPPRLDG